jgi:hypothetical protein
MPADIAHLLRFFYSRYFLREVYGPARSPLIDNGTWKRKKVNSSF